MRVAIAAAAGLLSLCAGTAVAQIDPGRAVINGTIRASADSAPLSGVEVYVVGSQERTTTDKLGRFRFTGLYPGRYEVRARRMGFEQLVKFVTVAGGETNTNDWQMHVLAVQLSEVRINGRLVPVPSYLQEPYRRAAWGFGDFLLPEDIERRNAFHTADLFDAIPGAHVYDNGKVDFARCSVLDVPPGREGVQVYIDGRIATNPWTTVAQALELVTPRDVEMVEVYRGVARLPAEFAKDACAAIAIWLKHG